VGRDRCCDREVVVETRHDLVVKLKKEPRETDYRVMAYCYRVNEDGTAIKKEVINKSVSPDYTTARDYARGLRNEINCEEYFK
jgi:hypothetical protein